MPELRLGLEEQEGGIQTGELLHRLPSLAPIPGACFGRTVRRYRPAPWGRRRDRPLPSCPWGRRRGGSSRGTTSTRTCCARAGAGVRRARGSRSAGSRTSPRQATTSPTTWPATRSWSPAPGRASVTLANVCRHRSMVIMSGAGNARGAAVPLPPDGPTPWTARSDGAPADRRVRGLRQGGPLLPRLAVETWQGFVLANTDTTAAPIGPRLRVRCADGAGQRLPAPEHGDHERVGQRAGAAVPVPPVDLQPRRVARRCTAVGRRPGVRQGRPLPPPPGRRDLAGVRARQHRRGRGAARAAARRPRRGGRRAADGRDGAGRLDQLGPDLELEGHLRELRRVVPPPGRPHRHAPAVLPG